MALTADGRIAGSVSGGCVENAVVEAGKKTLSSGKPQLLHYGVSDDTAWSVGLACGGSLDVFVERLDPALFEPVGAALRAEKPVAIATVIRGPEGDLGRKLAVFEDGTVAGAIDDAVLAEARSALASGASRRIPSEDREIFVDVLRASPRLVIVGGVHIAVTLVTLAKTLGFRTILVDPREAFGNAKRFPHADEILNDWPDAALAARRSGQLDGRRRSDARPQARRSGPPRRPPPPGLSTSARSARNARRRSGARASRRRESRPTSWPASTARSACRSAAARPRRSPSRSSRRSSPPETASPPEPRLGRRPPANPRSARAQANSAARRRRCRRRSPR